MLSTKRCRASSSSNSSQLLSSSSAELIASNDDILTLILVCLPLKSLLKFKTVSKHWLSLLTHPEFSPKYDSKTVSGLFVRPLSGQTTADYDFINLSPNPSRAPFKSLTFLDDLSKVVIVQSCNGLLLCRSFRANRPERTYYIYNPTTKQYTVLPGLSPAPRGRSSRNAFGFSLAFDPSKSPHYKVICLRNCDSDQPDHYQIEVYSSRTGPWRPAGCAFAAPINVVFDNGVFWNGAIHWLSDWGDSSLCFDVEEERIRDMPMPFVGDDARLCRYFGESGGHLHLIQLYGNLQLDVYEMEREYSGWFVKYQVDLNPIAAAFPGLLTVRVGQFTAKGSGDPIDLYSCEFSVLGVVQEESDEDSYLVLGLPHKAIRYNFKDSSFRKLHDFACYESSLGYDAYQFVQSFACV